MTTPGSGGSTPSEVADRKVEHVAVALDGGVSSQCGPGWGDVQLIHQSLPEVDLDDVDVSTTFLGASLACPVVIPSMTGGHPAVKRLNGVLARVAGEFGAAMGVGSQRAAVADRALAHTYAVARETAPSAYLIANIGAAQLIDQVRHPAFTSEQVRFAVDMIHADALAVHLNCLQEAVQREGDRRASGCADALASLTAALELPVVAKETGAGVCREQARLLESCGVAAIDVGGAGGTSMAAIEMYRSRAHKDDASASLGAVFRDWGIATPVSLVEASVASVPLIATGGVRTGLDAAKALALGATLVGVGRPLMRAAAEGYEGAARFLAGFLAELRTALFLTGAATVAELRHRDVVVTGETGRWLELRGFDLAAFARRRAGTRLRGVPEAVSWR